MFRFSLLLLSLFCFVLPSIAAPKAQPKSVKKVVAKPVAKPTPKPTPTPVPSPTPAPTPTPQSPPAEAQTPVPAAAASPVPDNKNGEGEAGTYAEQKLKEASRYEVVSISYHSWVEKMFLDTPSLTDVAFASFGGTGIHYEHQFFWGRSGLNFEVAGLFGAASAGGTSVLVPYTSPKTTYWGAMTSIRAETRLTPQVSFVAGPMLLYRNIKWNTESVTNLKASSGSDINFGLVGELKIRLSPKWDLRQEIGALAFNATTYWQFGLGYRF